jgi:hypothetical protein
MLVDLRVCVGWMQVGESAAAVQGVRADIAAACHLLAA